MAAPSARERVRAAFEQPRYEIIPMKGVEEQVAYLPSNAIVTVTSSPTKGTEATLELTARLQTRDLAAIVPHLAARSIRDAGHLKDLLHQVSDLGITEVFAVAGDAPTPAGDFEGTASLLHAMADIGHNLQVGITGYPESHAFIPDDTTIQAMFDKEPHASYIVSQVCYDPAAITRWVARVRERGTQLPIYLGLPGVVDFARLLRISKRVGIGDSMRFLRKQWSTVARLVGGYQPDELVDALAPLIADPAKNVPGLHMFTFNEVRRTEEWRQNLLARYARSTT
jgi:methylenetetrahydrofolate reductase (NADPH)